MLQQVQTEEALHTFILRNFTVVSIDTELFVTSMLEQIIQNDYIQCSSVDRNTTKQSSTSQFL